MVRIVFFIVFLICFSFSSYAQFEQTKRKVNISAMPDKAKKKKAILPETPPTTVTPEIKFESQYFKKEDDILLRSLPKMPKVGEVETPKTYEVRSVSEIYTEKIQTKMAQEGISREILNSDIFLGEYTVYTNEIKISARDYSAVDGDLVRIWLNGEIVTKVIDLETGYQRYDYILKEGLNVIQIEALNIGLSFPNTGQFSFVDGNGKMITEQFWGLNEGYRATIKVYKKKGLEEEKENK
jgi:hypothetical protein